LEEARSKVPSLRPRSRRRGSLVSRKRAAISSKLRITGRAAAPIDLVVPLASGTLRTETQLKPPCLPLDGNNPLILNLTFPPRVVGDLVLYRLRSGVLATLNLIPSKITLQSSASQFSVQSSGAACRVYAFCGRCGPYGGSPDSTNPAVSGMAPCRKKSFDASDLRHSPQTCRKRLRFVASSCFHAAVEATTGSSLSVRLYCVCVRNEEPVPSSIHWNFWQTAHSLPPRSECGAPPVLGVDA